MSSAVDGLRGDEIPIDGVAESLVEADAVLIHGKPLRRSLDRRGDEAAKAQILREIIAVDIDGDGAGNLLLQCVRHAGGIGAGEILRRHGLHHARDIVGVFAAARQRRGCDHFHCWQCDRRTGRGRSGGLRQALRHSARPKPSAKPQNLRMTR